MAVPKKRTGARKQATRRANWKAIKPATTKCSHCGATVLAHTVCTECGYYKGKAVSIKSADYVEATEANVLAGTYALQRPFVMATKGEISEQNAAVKAWLDYVFSDEGKEIIKGAGLIIPE